jgi:hypothetical protein
MKSHEFFETPTLNSRRKNINITSHVYTLYLYIVTLIILCTIYHFCAVSGKQVLGNIDVKKNV